MTTGTQTTVGRFVWHDLQATDIEQAKRFYTELFGWQVETWKPGEMDYPMISAKGSQHGGFGPAPEGGAPSQWVGHVVVEDADAAAERAMGAGGTLVMDPMDIAEVGRFAIIRDPQGAVVSAFQPAGQAPVPEGVFVWDELITTDVEDAKRFYGELFGWTSRDVDMGQGMYTLFAVGEKDIAGCLAAREPGTPPHWYPYVGTPVVDASFAKATELGGNAYMGPTEMEGVGKFAVLADPTGATFGLFQEPAS